MERTAVISSNVESIGYDPEHEVVEVEFKGGRIYHYPGVPQEVWDSRDDLGSIGKFVAHTIKPSYEFGHGEFVAPEPPEPEVEEEPESEPCPKCGILVPVEAMDIHLPTCSGGDDDDPPDEDPHD